MVRFDPQLRSNRLGLNFDNGHSCVLVIGVEQGCPSIYGEEGDLVRAEEQAILVWSGLVYEPQPITRSLPLPQRIIHRERISSFLMINHPIVIFNLNPIF